MQVLIFSYAYWAMCFSDIVYSMVYCTCIIITKYGCVFLKLGKSIIIRGNGSHSHTLGFAPARP